MADERPAPRTCGRINSLFNLFKKMNRTVAALLVTGVLTACSGGSPASEPTDSESLEEQLREYIAEKEPAIGVAVVIDGKDTVMVNGQDRFPMLSVYKFPQAISVARFCRENGLELTDTVAIAAEELRPDTWSPLRDKYGGTSRLRLPISELLEYTICRSDNNACDILFHLIGGPSYSDSVITSLGFPDIDLISTEEEMHRDVDLCYVNSSTPIEMARLMDAFCRSLRHETPECGFIASLMERCDTGSGRLAAPISDENVVIGHKTGTGDIDPLGNIIAVNDCGYVKLPDGPQYVISVFITGSPYSMEETEKTIADISAIVYDYVSSSK